MSAVLKKDGFYRQFSTKYETHDVKAHIGDIFKLWNDELAIDNGVTLRDFLKEFDKIDPITFMHVEDLLDDEISPFLIEFRADASPVQIVKDEWLEVKKYSDLFTSKGGEISGVKLDPIKIPVFSCSVTMSSRKGDKEHYAVDFTPLKSLLDLELKLSSEHLHTTFFDGELMDTVATSDITVGEFMHAVFEEICFNGTPEARDSRMSDLKIMAESFHANKEEGSNKVIPFLSSDRKK